MSGVRLLVGTRKGGFVSAVPDGKRKKWKVSGPRTSPGWEIYQNKGSPADPDRIYGLAVERLARSGDAALERWRRDLGSGGQRVGLRRGAPARTSGTTERSIPGSSSGCGTWSRRSTIRTPCSRRGGRGPVPKQSTAAKHAGDSGTARRAARRPNWKPGAGGMCLHTILLDPSHPERIYVAISAAGGFRTEDGGNTWRPINRGLKLALPTPIAEVGHCVHRIDSTLPSQRPCSCRSTGM